MAYHTPDTDSPIVWLSLPLPAALVHIALGQLAVLESRFMFETHGTMTREEAATWFLDAVRQYEIDMIPIGTILPTVNNNPPIGWLMCDGASYAIDDYPALAAMLPDDYKTGETFVTPELGGRFLLGSDDERPLFDLGGSEGVYLSVSNLPAHSHSVHGHGAVANIEEPLPGLPYPISTPGLPALTGETGGNEEVPIMPPYMVVNYMIRAR